MGDLRVYSDILKTVRTIKKLSGQSRNCPDNLICLGFTRICREIGDVEIYALYPESFCGENLAIRKVFAFSDSGALKTKDPCADSYIHPWTFVCRRNKGLKKGLKIALCGGLVPALGDIARMAATQREILPCSSPTT